MQARHKDKELYFKEQVHTTERYVIPFIRETGHINAGMSVLEIGCGEGGNLKPFLDMGCRITGIDLSQTKIGIARKKFEDHPASHLAKFIANDIYLAAGQLDDKYDLIVMRDVIEHIHDQERFMFYVKRFMKPGSVFFLAFPPWYNPYGGHQQICQNRILSKLPYFHLLPLPFYKAILKAGGEPAERIEALSEIKLTGISIERFEKILLKTGFKTRIRKMYLFNPNYEIKFGIKPRYQNRLITAIPFLRNFVTTAIYYVIEINHQ